jgi:hypothetical protein
MLRGISVRDHSEHMRSRLRALPTRGHLSATEVRIVAQGCVAQMHTAGERPPFSLTIRRDRPGAPVALGHAEVEIMRMPLMLSALLALTTMSASGDEQLKIAVSPAQSFAPSNLNIRARVVPNAENRAIEVVAESDEFYRSSQIPLEGEHAPATILFEFRSLPGGEYQVYGILTDSVGRRRAVVQQQIRVLDRFGQ